MNKCRFFLIVLLLGLLVVFSVGATGGTPQLKIQNALGVTDAPDVHRIPVGSTIIHLPNGSTEITGPDGKLLMSAQAGEVALTSTPHGMAKADHVYEVPSGSFVHGASPDTIEVYNADGKVILTVIDQAGEAGLQAAQTVPAAYDGNWIEDADWVGPESFGHLYGQWAVPITPNYTLEDGSVVYLFDGIQGDGANTWAGRTVVLQPVIGYNEDRAQPGNQLSGRVWVVSGPGANDAFKTDPIGASVGDVISGAMSYATGQQLWVSVIRDQNTGNYKVLTTDLLGTTNQFVCVTLEGYCLDTDSDLFATTDFRNLQVFDQNGGTIYPSWQPWIDPDALEVFNKLGVIIYDYSHVRLKTNRVPSGGGCPFLQVWDGSDYVHEGLLDIHNAESVDVTYEHTLGTVPEAVGGAYKFRLGEHPQTTSDIDQVRLCAILEDGRIEELPLRKAWHSDDGNVRNLLLKSDDCRVEEKGADHNGGTSQSIDLDFAALGRDAKAVAFVFTIEGYNIYVK